MDIYITPEGKIIEGAQKEASEVVGVLQAKIDFATKEIAVYQGYIDARTVLIQDTQAQIDEIQNDPKVIAANEKIVEEPIVVTP